MTQLWITPGKRRNNPEKDAVNPEKDAIGISKSLIINGNPAL
jgi:hypothetical protein